MRVRLENITFVAVSYLIKNADRPSRPDFTELVHVLFSPVTDLLSWSEEDVRIHPQAAVLGASLEAGKDLYPELQWTYMHNQ